MGSAFERLADALMLSAEERRKLFDLALPQLKLDAASTFCASNEIESVVHTIARLRERYLLTGSVDDLVARPRVLKSWQRCLEMGADGKVLRTAGDLYRGRQVSRGEFEAEST